MAGTKFGRWFGLLGNVMSWRGVKGGLEERHLESRVMECSYESKFALFISDYYQGRTKMLNALVGRVFTG